MCATGFSFSFTVFVTSCIKVEVGIPFMVAVVMELHV